MTGEIVAIMPRNDDPEDDLVVYAEEPHKPTIDWIKRITSPNPRPLSESLMAKLRRWVGQLR